MIGIMRKRPAVGRDYKSGCCWLVGVAYRDSVNYSGRVKKPWKQRDSYVNTETEMLDRGQIQELKDAWQGRRKMMIEKIRMLVMSSGAFQKAASDTAW